MSNLIRKEKKLFFISFTFLFTSLVFSFFYMQFDPDAIFSIRSEYQVSVLKENFNPDLIALRGDTSFPEDLSMLKFYIINNASAGLSIFIAGLLLGAGSLFLLIYQGMSMGVLMGYVVSIGYGEALWPFIIGHSSLELLASVLSGVGGLIIGRSLIWPENESRFKSLVSGFNYSLVFALLATCLYIVAAFIEAFWSSNINIAISAKYFFGSVLWLLVIYVFYLLFKKADVS